MYIELQAMTGTITLDVDLDKEALYEAIEHDLTDVENGEIKGSASADVEKIVEKSINDISLVESNLPTPVAIAISNSIYRD